MVIYVSQMKSTKNWLRNKNCFDEWEKKKEKALHNF